MSYDDETVADDAGFSASKSSTKINNNTVISKQKGKV